MGRVSTILGRECLAGSDGRPPPLADRAHAALVEAIVSGDIPPGAKISEPDLARRLGISRGPLREAVRRLEERGLVQRRPHAGVRVVELSLSDVLDVFTVREALEGMAARLAALRRTEADIDDLRALVERQAASIRTGADADLRREEASFHSAVARLSGSAQIMSILGSDLHRMIRNYRLRMRVAAAGRGERAVEEHRRIVDAIAEQDTDLAELLMRRHVAAARTVLHADLVAGDASADEGGNEA